MKHTIATLATLAMASVALAGGGKAPVDKNPPPVITPECPDMLSYRYLEAGYIRVDLDQASELDGGYLDLSYEVAPNFFIDSALTFLDGDFDVNSYQIGLGTYWAVCKPFHFTLRGGWTYVDGEFNSDDEFYIAPGFRTQLGCNLELWGKAYCVFNDDDEYLSIGGGLTYHINENYGITVGAAVSEDDDVAVQAGFRYQF